MTQTLAQGSYYVVVRGLDASNGQGEQPFQLSIRDAGVAKSIVCADGTTTGGTATIARSAAQLPAGTYYVGVTGNGTGGGATTGNYQIAFRDTSVSPGGATQLDCELGELEYAVVGGTPYYVVVKGNSATDKGAYTLRLTDVGAVTDMACGAVQADDAAPDAYMAFSVTGAPDKNVVVDMDGSALDAVYELWQEGGGAPIGCASGIGSSLVPDDPLAAGNYYVKIRAKDASYGGGERPLQISVRDDAALKAVECQDGTATLGSSITRNVPAGTYWAAIKPQPGAMPGPYTVAFSAIDEQSDAAIVGTCETDRTQDYTVNANTPYYVIVKGAGAGQKGTFGLTVTDIAAIDGVDTEYNEWPFTNDLGCGADPSAPDAFYEFTVADNDADGRDVEVDVTGSVHTCAAPVNGSCWAFQLWKDVGNDGATTPDVPCRTDGVTTTCSAGSTGCGNTFLKYVDLNAAAADTVPNQKYYVVARGLSAANGAADQQVKVSIKDVDGTGALACAVGQGTAGNEAEIEETLGAGTYYAAITGATGASGAYQISFADKAVSSGMGALQVGCSETGTLDYDITTPGPYYVIVKGATNTAPNNGTFSLTVTDVENVTDICPELPPNDPLRADESAPDAYVEFDVADGGDGSGPDTNPGRDVTVDTAGTVLTGKFRLFRDVGNDGNPGNDVPCGSDGVCGQGQGACQALGSSTTYQNLNAGVGGTGRYYVVLRGNDVTGEMAQKPFAVSIRDEDALGSIACLDGPVADSKIVRTLQPGRYYVGVTGTAGQPGNSGDYKVVFNQEGVAAVVAPVQLDCSESSIDTATFNPANALTVGKPYFVLVKGKTPADTGPYGLTISDLSGAPSFGCGDDPTAGDAFFQFDVTDPMGTMVTVDTEGSALDTVVAVLPATANFFADYRDNAALTCCAGTREGTAGAGTCADDIDNDGDGKTDLADSDCAGVQEGLAGAGSCNNGLDDDGDGAVDAADSQCLATRNCLPVAMCDGKPDDMLGCDDDALGSGDSRVTKFLSQGTYLAVVREKLGATGMDKTFELSVRDDDSLAPVACDGTNGGVKAILGGDQTQEGTAGAGSCTDTADNDGDGAIDAADGDCAAPDGIADLVLQPGTYYAALSGAGASATGSYTLRFRDYDRILNSATQVAGACGASGSLDTVAFDAKAGTPYYATVKGATSGAEGAYKLTVENLQAVAGMGCGADPESPDAFYKFRVSQSTQVQIDTEGSDIDTVIALYPGSLDIYRKAITIASGKVTAALTDFPVLVRLSGDADLIAKARTDGRDIQFKDTGDNPLAFERVFWDKPTGRLTAWVKVPNIPTSGTSFYLYYGDTNATTDLSNPVSTWSNGYEAVWHLDETAPAGPLKDAKGTYDSTELGGSATWATAAVGSGRDFAPPGYATVGNVSPPSALTLSGWVNYDGIWTPSNFTPASYTYTKDVIFNCSVVYDSTSDTFTPSGCCASGCPDVSANVPQVGSTGGPLVDILRFKSLSLTSTFTLRGQHPVILAVDGDATVTGTIDASAYGATPGAGGSWSGCGSSAGTIGGSHNGNHTGAGGGGGGGFNLAGGTGGAGHQGPGGGAGGQVAANLTLIPLRGGCRGGDSGEGRQGGASTGGAGGGAVQISARGRVTVSGTIDAGGGGGAAGVPQNEEDGGGGGGSGGAILLEGTPVTISGNLRAKGGGGAGSSSGYDDQYPGQAGSDGRGNNGAGGPPNGGASSGPQTGGTGVIPGNTGQNGANGEISPCGFCSDIEGAGGSGGGGGGGVIISRPPTSTPFATVFGKSGQEYVFGKDSQANGRVRFFYAGTDANTHVWATTADVFATAAWRHFALTFDTGVAPIFYGSGAVVANTKTTGPAGSPARATNGGALHLAARDALGAEGMDGKLDELRVSRVVRSAAWIKAEFDNQNNPATFYAVGVPQLVGASYFGTNYAENAAGNVINCDADSGPGGSSLISETLKPGDYYVMVKNDASGWGQSSQPFKVSIKDAGTSGQSAIACAPATGTGMPSLTRSLAPGDYYVVVSGDNTTGGAYDISFKNQSAETNAAQLVACNDTEDTITHAIEPNKNYYVVVKGDETVQKGTYTLTVETTDTGAVNMGCGAAAESPDAFFKFTVTSETPVTIDTDGSELDTVIALYPGSVTSFGTDYATDASGGVIDCDDDGGAGTASKITTTLAPGDYYVVVKGKSGVWGATSPFNISIRDDGASGALACANSTSGNTSIVRDLDPGDYLVVLSDQGSGGGAYNLTFKDLSSTATQIGSPLNCATGTFDWDLEGGKAYYAVVKGTTTSDQGPYSLTVQDTASAKGEGGSTAVGCVAEGGEIDGTFPAGDYWAVVTGTANNEGDYILEAKDPSGFADYNRVACDAESGPNGTSMIEADLQPGTHYVVVKGDGAGQRGTYQLHVRDTVSHDDKQIACSNLTEGESTFDASGAGAERISVGHKTNQVSVKAGQDYTVVMKGTEKFASGDFNVKLYDQNNLPASGQYVACNTSCPDHAPYNTSTDCTGKIGAAASQFTVNLDPGTYYASVKGRRAKNKGPFELQIGDENKGAAGVTYAPPTWTDTRDELLRSGVKVLPVISCSPSTQYNYGRCAGTWAQAQKLAEETGAKSPTTGQGIYQKINTDGSGVGSKLALAVRDLANYLTMKITLQPVPEPDGYCDAQNHCFGIDIEARRVKPYDPQGSTGCDDPEPRSNHFNNCQPGAVPKFRVKFSNPYPPLDVKPNPDDPFGGYHFKLQIVGTACPLDSSGRPQCSNFVLQEIPVYLIPEDENGKEYMFVPANYAKTGTYEQWLQGKGCSGINDVPFWSDLFFDAQMASNSGISFNMCTGATLAEAQQCADDGNFDRIATVLGAPTGGACATDAACKGVVVGGATRDGFCNRGSCQFIVPPKTGGFCTNDSECPQGDAEVGSKTYDISSKCDTMENKCVYSTMPAGVAGGVQAGRNGKPFVVMQVGLFSDGRSTPILYDWRLTYNCETIL
jgi:hypothetical protein